MDLKLHVLTSFTKGVGVGGWGGGGGAQAFTACCCARGKGWAVILLRLG